MMTMGLLLGDKTKVLKIHYELGIRGRLVYPTWKNNVK